MGILSTWAGKLGVTALYKVVKGFFDSFFENRRKEKEIQKLEEQAAYKVESEHFEEYKDVIQKSRGIENRPRSRDIRSIFKRMRGGTKRNQD